jgi:hypothetical protein
VITIIGLAMVGGAVALLFAFRRPEGHTKARAEWIDVSLALIVTAAVGGGAVLVGAGIVGLFF